MLFKEAVFIGIDPPSGEKSLTYAALDKDLGPHRLVVLSDSLGTPPLRGQIAGAAVAVEQVDGVGFFVWFEFGLFQINFEADRCGGFCWWAESGLCGSQCTAQAQPGLDE